MNIDGEVHRLAATDIQAIFRGYQTRCKARQSKELTGHVQELAASTLQSTARGFLHSKRIHQRRCKQQRSTAINLAAQTLQSAWRIFLLRKKCGHYLQRLLRLREDEKECQPRPIISSPTSTPTSSSTFSAASYEEEDEEEARIMAPTLQVTAATVDDERWAYLPIPTSSAPLFSPPPAHSDYEEDGCEDRKRTKRGDNYDDAAVEKQEDQDEGLWLASSINTKKGILEERRKDGDWRPQALVEEEEAQEQREKKEAWQWSEGDDHQTDQRQSTVTSNPPVVTQHDDAPTSNLAGSTSHRSKSGNTVDQQQRREIAAVDNSSSKAIMLAKMARERQQAMQTAFRHAVAVCCQEIEVNRSELVIILQGIGVLKEGEEGDDDDDGSDCKNDERSRTYRLSLACDHDTAFSLVRACDQAGLKEEELASTTTTSRTIISAPRAALARQHLLKLIKGEGPEGEAYAFILAQSSSSPIASWTIDQITDYAGSLDVPLEAIKKARQAGKLNKAPRLLLHLSSTTQRTDGNEAEEGEGLIMALGVESSVLKRRLDLYGRILRDIHAWETCGIWPGKAAEEQQRQQHRQQQHRSSRQIDPFPPSNITLRRRQEPLTLPRLKKRRGDMKQFVAITTPSLTLLSTSEAIIASSPLTTAAESVLHNRPGYVRLTPSTAKEGALVWIAPLQELTRAFRSAWRAHGLVDDSERPFNLEDENGPHRYKDNQASLEDRIWDLQAGGVPERYGRVLGPVTLSLSCSSPTALHSSLLRVALLEPCVGTIMTSSSTSLKQITLPSTQWLLPSDNGEGQKQNEAIVVELPIRGLYELPSGLKPQALRMGRRVRVAEGQDLRTCLDRASWVDTRETYLDILALEGMEAIVLSTKHARQLGRVGIRTMDAQGFEDAVPLEALQALSDDEEKSPETRHRKGRASRTSNRSRTRNTSSSSFVFMHTPSDPRRRSDDHDVHQENEEKGRHIPTPRTTSKYHGPRHHRSSTASRSNSPINTLLFQRRQKAYSFQAPATITSRRRHRSFLFVDNDNDGTHPPYQSASEGEGQGLDQKKLSIKGKEDGHLAAKPLVLPSIDSSPRPSPPHTGTTATIPIISVQVIPNTTQQQRPPSPPSSSLFDPPKHLHHLYRPPPTTTSSSPVKGAKIEQEEDVKRLERAWKRDRRVEAVVVEHAGGDGEVNEARGRPSSSPSTMRRHQKNRSLRGDSRSNSPLKMSHYLEPNRDEHHNHHSASHHDEVHPPHPSSSTQRAPLELTPIALVFSPPPPPTSSSSARPRTSNSGTALPCLNATIAAGSTIASTKEPHHHPSQQQHHHTRSLFLNKAPPTVRITFNTDRTSTATTRPSSATAHARHASWNGGSNKVTTTSNADQHRDKSPSSSSSSFLSSIGDKGPRWRPRSASATTSSSSSLSSRKKQSRPAFYGDDEEEEKIGRRRRESSSPSPTKKRYWQSSGPARSFTLAHDDESEEHGKERSRSSTHSPSRSLVHTPRYYQQDRGGHQSSPKMAPAAALTPSSNIFMSDGELDRLVNLLNDFSSSTTNMTAAAAKAADSPSKSIKASVAEEKEKGGLRSAVFSVSTAAAAVDREDRRASNTGESAAGARRPLSAASASRARSNSNGRSSTPYKERRRTKTRNSLSSTSDDYTTTEGSRLEKKLKQIERQSQARMAQIRQAVERLQRTSSIPWDEEEKEEE